MTVSLADGGMGLGTMWGEQTARKMIGEAGFASIRTAQRDGDIVNTYIIASKGWVGGRAPGRGRRLPPGLCDRPRHEQGAFRRRCAGNGSAAALAFGRAGIGERRPSPR